MRNESNIIRMALLEAGLMDSTRNAFCDCVRKNATLRKFFRKPPSKAQFEKLKETYAKFAREYNGGNSSITRFSKPETELPEDFLELAKYLDWNGTEEFWEWRYLHRILEEEWVTDIYEYPHIEATTETIVTITVKMVEKTLWQLSEEKHRNIASLLAELNSSLGGKNTVLNGKKLTESERIGKLIDSILGLEIKDESAGKALPMTKKILEAIF